MNRKWYLGVQIKFKKRLDFFQISVFTVNI